MERDRQSHRQLLQEREFEVPKGAINHLPYSKVSNKIQEWTKPTFSFIPPLVASSFLASLR